jgi:muramoyltetrapeptide carboxypeptidase
MANAPCIPPPLKPGSRIGLAATARAVDPGVVESATEVIHSLGYEVIKASNLDAQYGIFAGTPIERANGLQALLEDPSVGAVLFMRGGYGTTQIINKLDFSATERNPKWLVGFSDLTFLLNAVARTGLATLHGPMGIHYHLPEHQRAVEAAFAAMEHRFAAYNEYLAESPVISACGSPTADWAVGHLVGGNLALLTHSIGTPYAPNFSGAILALEDIDEYHYQLDRMLWQLRHSGSLGHVKAIVLGHFADLKDNPDPFAPPYPQYLEDHAAELNIPLWHYRAFGHSAPNLPLLVGGTYKVGPGGVQYLANG